MAINRFASTAAAAKALGLSGYYTGRPCPQGHYSERNATTRKCIACVLARLSGNGDPSRPPITNRAPITITQKPQPAWAAGWAVKPEDPYKGWSPELREREERRLAARHLFRGGLEETGAPGRRREAC